MQILTIEEIFQGIFFGVDVKRLEAVPKTQKGKRKAIKSLTPIEPTQMIDLSLVQNTNLDSEFLELSGELKAIKIYNRPSLQKNRLQPFDLLITTRFKSFWCALVPENPPPCIAAGNICVLRQSDANVTSSHYIAIYLRSQAGIRSISTISHPVQTTAPNYRNWFYLNRQEILTLGTPIPSLPEQQIAIAAFQDLDSLRKKQQSEMKIQLNQFNQLFSEINQNLTGI